MDLNYWQESCLKMALNGMIRRMTSPSIPSLVKRGLMRRWGGRPGHIFYEITDLGKQTLAKHLVSETARKPETPNV